MRKFQLILSLAFIVGIFKVQAQFEIPAKPNKETSVYDYASVLSSTEKEALEEKLIRYADTTSTQIVIAIISTTEGENIGLLTPRWAHDWGIGQQDEDNGVFVLLARNDRNIWISPGYGVEHKLTAGRLGSITRQVIIPEFKKGDYYSGLDIGTDAIIEILEGTFKANSTPTEFPFWIFFIFIAIVVCIILLIIYAVKKGGGNKRGGRKRYRDSDIIEAIILSRMGRKSRGSRWGGSWGGSGGSSWGGSSGSGFGGGFGGGGFSGGGAGGSW